MKFYSFLVTGYLCCAYAENERATISADADGNLVLTSVSLVGTKTEFATLFYSCLLQLLCVSVFLSPPPRALSDALSMAGVIVRKNRKSTTPDIVSSSLTRPRPCTRPPSPPPPPTPTSTHMQGVAGSVLIDGLSLIEEVQDVRTHVSSLNTSVTSRIDLLTSDFDQLASKLTEAVDAVQAVDEKPPVAIYKDENSEGVVECTSSVHGHIRFLEDAQSVEFCHPLNNGKSGWTSFRPPNENSRGWPTTTTKTTTTKTTVTTTTATTTTVTTATTTTLVLVEVEQKFQDWTLDCGDSGPWASIVDDARTINPKTIEKNTWMASSSQYAACSWINKFWNGNHKSDYWRAKGHVPTPEAFEFVSPIHALP